MSAIMTTPRKKAKAPRPPDRHTEPRESFHLPGPLSAALSAYVDGSRPKTTKSAVIRLALEEFLTRVNLWPPAEGEG
jgi:hypothetical protein